MFDGMDEDDIDDYGYGIFTIFQYSHMEFMCIDNETLVPTEGWSNTTMSTDAPYADSETNDNSGATDHSTKTGTSLLLLIVLLSLL